MPSETLADVVRLLENIESNVLGLIASIRINPNQIQTNTISQISPNLGLFQAGELRTGNLTEPGLGYTGVRIAYPSMTYSGSEWNIVGVANDVLKFGVNAVTGLMYATDATISGTITATTGIIGGWTIGADSLYSLASSIGIILDSAIPAIKVGNTAGNYIIIDGANQRIRSSNYVAGATGSNWDTITGDIEVNNLTARGKIKTTVLEKDTISAVGGSLLVLRGDVLATDMSALDAEALTLSGDISLSVGDIVRMKDATDDEWMEVTDTSAAPTYVVTRDKAAAYAADTNPQWKKGQAVVNYGQSGDGGLLLQSGASPALYLFNHAGIPWTTVTNEVVLNEAGITAGAGAVLIDSTGVHTQYAGVYSEFNDVSTDTTPDIAFHEILPGNAMYTGFIADAAQVVVPNGTFETGDLTGWTTVYGTVAIDSTYKHGGSYSVKLTSAAVSTDRGTIESAAFITGGLSTGSVMIDFWAFKAASDTEGVVATIRAYDSSNVYIRDCNVQAVCYMTVANFWHNFRLIGQLPAGTAKVKLRLAAAGDTFLYVDDITFRGGRGAALYMNSQNLYTVEADMSILGDVTLQNIQFRNPSDTLLAQMLASEYPTWLTLSIETDVTGMDSYITIYSLSDDDKVASIDIMAGGVFGTTKQLADIYIYSDATGAGQSYININEAQMDVDTVIKSATNAAFFVVDAALEALGIGAAPSGSYALEVTGTANFSDNVTGIALNEIENLTADKTFNNSSNAISFNFTTAGGGATYDGAFEIQASGAFSGDLLHVHQHTGNPGASDLVHFESSDPDVTPLHVIHNSVDVFTIGPSNLVVNEGGADRDFRIEGDTNANLFVLDAGTGTIGIGAAPSGSYALEVTGTFGISGAATLSSTLAVTGTSTLAQARTSVQTITDDDVFSWAPPTTGGGMIFMSNNQAQEWAILFWNTTTPVCLGLSYGTSMVFGTGALSAGASGGTDAKMNINTHTDGKIYIKNRMGASRSPRWLLI